MENTYRQITQEEARKMMEDQDVIVLDVREQYEFDAGHIPSAVLLPVGTIAKDTAAAVIPELDSTVLVYCRSGNRSKTASKVLAVAASRSFGAGLPHSDDRRPFRRYRGAFPSSARRSDFRFRGALFLKRCGI